MMGINDYHFINRWRVEGTVEEVADIIAEPLEMARWWPAWCLAAKDIERGDDNGVGHKYLCKRVDALRDPVADARHRVGSSSSVRRPRER